MLGIFSLLSRYPLKYFAEGFSNPSLSQTSQHTLSASNSLCFTDRAYHSTISGKKCPDVHSIGVLAHEGLLQILSQFCRSCLLPYRRTLTRIFSISNNQLLHSILGYSDKPCKSCPILDFVIIYSIRF